MHILLTDETNKTPSEQVKFFAYGSIMFPVETLSKLDEKIRLIRVEAGYKPTDVLKFDTRVRPAQVTAAQATKAKAQVVEACKELGVKFVVCVILHDIMKNQDAAKKCYWAADYVISRFHQYLNAVKDDGMVIIDNVPEGEQYQYLTKKFTVGLEVGAKTFQLPRIKLYSSTCVGGSHACSAMDIVLGTFRFAINNPSHNVSRPMMLNIMSLIWHTRIGDEIHTLDRGLILRPQLDKITSRKYKASYDDLIKNINALIAEEKKEPAPEADEDVPW